jgi:hypothetical protein
VCHLGEPGCHLGEPGFKPQPGQFSSVINGFVKTHTVLHPCTSVKAGRGDSLSDKGVESTIRKQKPIVLDKKLPYDGEDRGRA